MQEAAQLMQEKQIRRLVTLNRANQLVGVVSLGDVGVESRNTQLAGEILERVSEPAEPRR